MLTALRVLIIIFYKARRWSVVDCYVLSSAIILFRHPAVLATVTMAEYWKIFLFNLLCVCVGHCNIGPIFFFVKREFYIPFQKSKHWETFEIRRNQEKKSKNNWEIEFCWKKNFIFYLKRRAKNKEDINTPNDQ